MLPLPNVRTGSKKLEFILKPAYSVNEDFKISRTWWEEVYLVLSCYKNNTINYNYSEVFLECLLGWWEERKEKHFENETSNPHCFSSVNKF